MQHDTSNTTSITSQATHTISTRMSNDHRGDNNKEAAEQRRTRTTTTERGEKGYEL